MPARILIISAVYPPIKAPEGDLIMHLRDRFRSAGAEVHLLTSVNAANGGDPQIYNIMGSWNWRDVPKIVRCIRKVKPDAILIMYVGWIYGGHPMITLLPTLVKTLYPKIEQVVMITNTLGSLPPLTTRAKAVLRIANLLARNHDELFGTMLRDCSRVCVLSEHHGTSLVAREPKLKDKLVLIPPPPILHISPATLETRARTRAQLGVADDEVLFTFFGYSYPGKGVETLIRAFILMADRLPKAKLMIAGHMTGELDPQGKPYGAMLRELSRPLGARFITGEYEADSDQGSAFLRAADVCVLPYDQGVQLNNSSVSAAMAHGLPIISTWHPTLESAFTDGKNIMLCAPKSPEAMAKAMMKLAGDPSLQATLAEGAEEFAKKWFSWERVLSLLFSPHREMGTAG